MEETNKNIATSGATEEKKSESVTNAPTANNAQQGADKRKFSRFGNKGNRRFQGRSRRDMPKEYEEKVVQINRVAKVVKGGKRMKFAALVVIGNGKGKYGFGNGKSGEVPDAIKKAVEKAKKAPSKVNLTKHGSITHEVIGNFGATKVFLKPAPDGTGIIAGGPVRSILELAGVKNVYAKIFGSRAPINVVRATFAALAGLKNYKDVLALRKGVVEDVK